MQASALAHPNIALVKYWGKRNVVKNLPAVGSLSVTLDTLHTRMTVEFRADGEDSLVVNGAEAPSMMGRVARCLDQVAGLGRLPAAVTSEGNFPIGAGLASSASAFAALVIAANTAADCGHDRLALARLAGAASGSAARSLYGGLVELDVCGEQIDLVQIAGANDWPLRIVVAITDDKAKPVGSGEGMIRSAKTSPFYMSWCVRQEEDLAAARAAVASRDFALLGEVSERNCLKMHSVMWSSRPPLVYWNTATIACMETVHALRADGHAVFFTIDAGPQVKVVCLTESVPTVVEVINETPGVQATIVTGVGDGARVVAS